MASNMGIMEAHKQGRQANLSLVSFVGSLPYLWGSITVGKLAAKKLYFVAGGAAALVAILCRWLRAQQLRRMRDQLMTIARSHPTEVTIVDFPVKWDAPAGTPFALKIEAYCKFAGIKYRKVTSNPDMAPKGKLPVLIDGDKLIPDSRWILLHLARTRHDLDAGLSPRERAQVEAFRVMIDEWAYQFVIRYILSTKENRQVFATQLLTNVPLPFRNLVPSLAKLGVDYALNALGLGRHSEQEIFELARTLLDSVENQLGDQPFMMGNEPCSLDASVFGLLRVIVGNTGFVYPLKVYLLREKRGLLNYITRVNQKYFPDDTTTLFQTLSDDVVCPT